MKKTKRFHLLAFVEHNTMKLKKFKAIKDLDNFKKTFEAKYPDYASQYPDNWLEFEVTNVGGELKIHSEFTKRPR